MKSLLSDAIDDYMYLRKSQDFSKRTLANERGILKRFLLVSGNVWVHQINTRQVTRYFEEASKTRTPNTLQLDHTVLTQFFEWARQTRRLAMDVNPMLGRRRPKVRKKERNRLHVSKFGHLLDAAEERDPRDRALCAILLYTLIRDNEAADLRIGDVDLDSLGLRVRITKSHTEDTMPICAELEVELRSWLSIYCAEVGRPLSANDYLLPTRTVLKALRSREHGYFEGHEMAYVPGRPIGRIGAVVRTVLTDIRFPVVDDEGKPAWEGSHTIRRSGARALFDRLAAEGYDRALRIVQSMLHHASVTQTEVYIGVTADRRGRDEILRGRQMFPIETDNVVQLSV